MKFWLYLRKYSAAVQTLVLLLLAEKGLAKVDLGVR